MSYLVLARKWRPQNFEEVVGQQHVTTTLANAIKAERVAHAYLFTGPRGVGKTTTARILARALNCETGPTPKPCGKCAPCKSISAGSNLDVLEIDGASNRGIDDVRELREQVRYAPSEGRSKVYIIDEVHMLTDQAFNALLKTLEEPPAHVVFVFATTSPQKIPVTILSRCQRFDFNLIPAQTILKRLKAITKKEKFKIDDAALALVARKARGSLRDAESLLDQVTSAAEGAVDEEAVTELLGIGGSELYFTLCDHINKSDAGAALKDADMALREGLDMGEFMGGLIEHLRALFLLSIDTELEEALDVPSSELPRYGEQAGLFKQKELLRLLEIATEAAGIMRRSEDPRFHADVALARMADVGTEEGLTDIVRRLEDLESRLASGAVAPSSGGGDGSSKKTSAKRGTTSPTRKGTTSGGRGKTGAQSYDGGWVEGAGNSVSAGDTARLAVGATGAEASRTGPLSDTGLSVEPSGGGEWSAAAGAAQDAGSAGASVDTPAEDPGKAGASADASAEGASDTGAGANAPDEGRGGTKVIGGPVGVEPPPADIGPEPPPIEVDHFAELAASESAPGGMKAEQQAAEPTALGGVKKTPPSAEPTSPAGVGASAALAPQEQSPTYVPSPVASATQEPTAISPDPASVMGSPGMTPTAAEPMPPAAEKPTALDGVKTPPAALDESLPQARLENLWSEVIKKVSEKKTYLGNFLSVAVPVEARDGSVAIGFPEAFSFHREQVSAHSNKRLVQEAMESVFGKFLGLRFLTVEDTRAGESAASPAAGESAAHTNAAGGSPPEHPAMIGSAGVDATMDNQTFDHAIMESGVPGLSPGPAVDPGTASAFDPGAGGSQQGLVPGGGPFEAPGAGAERLDEPLSRVLELFEGEIVDESGPKG